MAKSPASKRWLLFLVSAYQFLVKALVSIFFVTSLTIFLKKAGSQGMPYFYTSMNIVYISIQSFAARKLKGDSAGYLSISAWAIFVLSILRVTMPAADHLYIVTGFLLSVAVYDLFFNQFFINFINDIYPLQEGKANLPFISAFGSLGYIASGVVLKLALSVVDIRTVMAGNIVLILISQGVLVLTKRAAGVEQKEEKDKKEKKEEKEKEEKEAPDDVSIGILGKFLVAVFFFQMFGKYWLDYQYTKTINAAFTTEEDLASFIAIFCACCDFLVLASLMGLTGRLLKKIRLSTALSFIPVALFFLCIPVIFTSSFYLIVTCQFIFVFLARALHNPSAGLIVAIMPAARRIRTMSYAGMAASSGSLLVGLSLLVVQDILTTPVAFATSLLMFASTFIAVRYIDSAYQQELVRALDEGSNEGRLAAARKLAAMASYNERVERLQEYLQGDEELKKEAITLAAPLRPGDVENLLLPLFEGAENPHLQASAARVLVTSGGEHAREKLAELMMDKDGDARLRANIVEAIGMINEGVSFVKRAAELLNDDNHRIRANSAVTVIRLSNDENDVQKALDTLWKMLDDKETPINRAAAVSAMGRLQHYAFVPELADSLRDPQEEVANQALLALGQLPTPAVAELLHEYLGEKPPEVMANRARLELNRIKRLNVEEVCQLLDAFDADERARVGNFLAGIEDDAEMAVVMHALRITNGGHRRAFTTFFKEEHDKRLYETMRECFKEEESGDCVIDADCIANTVTNTDLLQNQSFSKIMELLAFEKAMELYDKLLLHYVKRLFVLDCSLQQLEVEEGKEIVKEERQILCELTAARTGEVSRALDALENVQSSDTFAASVGIEFLSSRLPNELSAAVVHYLQSFRDKEASLKECLSILGLKADDVEKEQWQEIFAQRIGSSIDV